MRRRSHSAELISAQRSEAEPTSGLDGRGVREVSAWCRTLAAGGKAVAIITHDNLLAALAGDAVVELKG